MNKKGQFFLIAALVIIGIVTGLLTIYNTSKPARSDTTVYDLTSEVDFEATQIIDRGILANTTQNISTQLENLSDTYAKANTDSDILVIYGNESVLTFILYNRTSTGNVGISFGGTEMSFQQSSVGKLINSSVAYPKNGEVSVILPPGVAYNFTLEQGMPFFIVLRKNTAGQSYISNSDTPPQTTNKK